jgi:hypothetical protein
VRRLATAERIRAFLDRLGRRATMPATVYLTGGATAVLIGWRDATIDIDLKLVPDRDELLRLLPVLKEELEVNVEAVEPYLFRYPTVDAASLRTHVEDCVTEA